MGLSTDRSFLNNTGSIGCEYCLATKPPLSWGSTRTIPMAVKLLSVYRRGQGRRWNDSAVKLKSANRQEGEEKRSIHQRRQALSLALSMGQACLLHALRVIGVILARPTRPKKVLQDQLSRPLILVASPHRIELLLMCSFRKKMSFFLRSSVRPSRSLPSPK